MAVRTRRPVHLDVGLEPLVDLLPAEIRRERAQGRIVRRAWVGVGGVALVVALSVGAAAYNAGVAAEGLRQAQSRTTDLAAQQARYAPVVKADKEVALIRAAQQVGASTEVDWSAYLTTIQDKLPAGTKITAATIESASPMQTFQQATAPLQGSRIATLTFTVGSEDLPSIPAWLSSLSSMPGYVDAAPQSISGGDESSGEFPFTTQLTMHVDAEAYAGRFVDMKKKG